MPNPSWTQGRVGLMLRHTYTRSPRQQTLPPPGDFDDWGNPVTIYAFGAQVPNVPCLFIDESSYLLAPGGFVTVEENRLCVAQDDPLVVGDQILNVVDPVTGKILHKGPSTVENFLEVASHGYVLYRYAQLYAGDAGH